MITGAGLNDYPKGEQVYMTTRERDIIKQKAGKILAVNSDPEVIRILGVNFTHANLEFVSAHNGREALNKTLAENPDIIILDPALPDIDINEVYRQLQESPRTCNIPIIIMGVKKTRRPISARTGNGAIDYITKPFDPNDIVSLVQTHLKQKKRTENTNPLTGLPNQIQVTFELTELINREKPFGVICFALDGLKQFNKIHGYRRGDDILQILADIITDKVALRGNPDDLVAHTSGSKFTVISTTRNIKTLLQSITAAFNWRIAELYQIHNNTEGYNGEKTRETKKQIPVINLNTVIVTSAERKFKHHIEVSEALTEKMNRRNVTAGNSNDTAPEKPLNHPDMTAASGCVSNTQREELRALRGVLDWLDFTIRELSSPLAASQEDINSFVGADASNLSPNQQHALNNIRETMGRLNQVMDGLNHLTRSNWHTASSVFEEVDIAETLDWVIKQVSETTLEGAIKIECSVSENLRRIFTDRRTLTEALLHALRNEIRFVASGGELEIRAAEINEEFISIIISNRNHSGHTDRPDNSSGNYTDTTGLDELKSKNFPAKLMLQELGGKMTVNSENLHEITYTFIVPRKWRGWTQDINSLQLAAEVSRKEAQTELANIRRLVSSDTEPEPFIIKDSIERLKDKIQELGILYNQTLFLTEELSSRLDIQQDSLLQQETEQTACIEAVLAVGRETAESYNIKGVFNPESTRRIVQSALSIAREFKLSEDECRSLRYAAMLNDLGLLLSPGESPKIMPAVTETEVSKIRRSFYSIWNALSGIPFLQESLLYIRYIYHLYDDDSGINHADNPLATKILAVAIAYERLYPGLKSPEKRNPEQALVKFVNDSAGDFDPEVLNTYLQLWRH